MPKFKINVTWLSTLAIYLAIFGLISVMPAEAVPGGIIKAASKNIFVQIGFCALAAILLPLIIWYWQKRSKHIKQVHADLTALAARHPQYQWMNLKDRTTSVFHWVWSAWNDQKMSTASDYMTHWYWQNQQLILNRWEKDGLENVCRLKNIVKMTPLFVQHVESPNCDGSRVVVEVVANVVDYLQEKGSGTLVQGDKKESEITTLWTMMWDGSEWRLNNIEDEAADINYIGVPNQIPAMTLEATGRASGEPG